MFEYQALRCFRCTLYRAIEKELTKMSYGSKSIFKLLFAHAQISS